MAKKPELHPYSDRRSYERLLLLVAAIARNPGIGKQGDGDPMAVIIEAMQAISEQLGLDFDGCSPHTLRADLKELRRTGVIPKETALRKGYYLGEKLEWDMPKPEIKPRKSKLSAKQILALRAQGNTYQAIADVAGLSRQRIEQICKGF